MRLDRGRRRRPNFSVSMFMVYRSARLGRLSRRGRRIFRARLGRLTIPRRRRRPSRRRRPRSSRNEHRPTRCGPRRLSVEAVGGGDLRHAGAPNLVADATNLADGRPPRASSSGRPHGQAACSAVGHSAGQEPSALAAHAGICAGGRSRERSLPRSRMMPLPLHRRWAHLDTARAKKRTTVAVAVARELACFRVGDRPATRLTLRSHIPFGVGVAAGAASHGTRDHAMSTDTTCIGALVLRPRPWRSARPS